MKRYAIAVLGLTTLACAPVSRPPVETKSSSCISLANVGGKRVVGKDTLLFEMVGRVNYRNRLTPHCPATIRLGSSATIVFPDLQGGQICSGDRVRVIDPAERISTAPECPLGSFEPVAR